MTFQPGFRFYIASGGSPVVGNAIGLLLALTYSTYTPPPSPTTGNPIGLLLSLTYA